MIGKLLTTTALVFALSSGAHAATSATAPSSNSVATSSVMTNGYTMVPTDALASKIMGIKVFDSTAQNAQQVGTIKDLVLNQQGVVTAAVIGVGGFLGVGQKDVAVDYPQLKWAANADGTDRATLATTKDALNAAPAFKWPSNMASPAAMTTNTMAPATTAGATVTTQGTGMDKNAAMSSTATVASPSNAEVNPENLSAVDTATMKSDDLKGIDVISPTGVKLGSIGDFVLTKGGKVDAVLVDFGGFLGIGTKQVAIQYSGLKFLTDTNNKRYLEVNVTKDQLNAQQAYNKDTYAKNRNQQLLTANS